MILLQKIGKLYTYPYSFLRITNNSGNYNDYKIEDFEEKDEEEQITDDLKFNVIGIPCIGYSGKIRPKHYQGIARNEDESLPLGKYPTFSWSTDAFTNWITQNGVNHVINSYTKLASEFLDAGSKAMSKQTTPFDFAESGLNIVNTITDTIGTFYAAGMQPNTPEGNSNMGDVSFAFNLTRFKIMHMRPKKEFLETIDNYFSMYGYKVNVVKTPNLTNRPNWNYVKTVGANILGSIPQLDLAEIKQMFDNGITLWHNPSTFLDYSQNNN